MGKSQSKDSTTPAAAPAAVVEYKPEYEVINSIDDPNYGKVKLIRELTSQHQMILKDFVFDSKQAFEQELKFFKDRATFDHPNIVQVIGYNTTSSQNLCSSMFKVSVFIEINSKELQTQLKERIKRNVHYSENDLLLVAENVVEALYHLQMKGMSHGDIRPVNIFVNGQVHKVTDPKLEVEKGDGLVKAIVNKSKTLLAPQLLAKVPTGKFEYTGDKHKADVFSLGATLLGLATLTNSEDLYNYEKGEFNYDLKEHRLEEVRSAYSPFTYELIRDMLHPDESHRPDFVALHDRLFPYQDAIHRKQDFQFFNSAPVVQNRQGERVKKSAAPPVQTRRFEDPALQQNFHHDNFYAEPNYHNDDYEANDLEARIREALQRSHDTYQQVYLADNTHPQDIPTRDSQVRGRNSGERVVRSAAPQRLQIEDMNSVPGHVVPNGYVSSPTYFQNEPTFGTDRTVSFAPMTESRVTPQYNTSTVQPTFGYSSSPLRHSDVEPRPSNQNIDPRRMNVDPSAYANITSYNYALGGSPERRSLSPNRISTSPKLANQGERVVRAYTPTNGEYRLSNATPPKRFDIPMYDANVDDYANYRVSGGLSDPRSSGIAGRYDPFRMASEEGRYVQNNYADNLGH